MKINDKQREFLIWVNDTTLFSDKKTTIETIRDSMDTMPFFAERRLIIVENSGLFKSASDDIVDFIKNLPAWPVQAACSSFKGLTDPNKIYYEEFKNYLVCNCFHNGLNLKQIKKHYNYLHLHKLPKVGFEVLKFDHCRNSSYN